MPPALTESRVGSLAHAAWFYWPVVLVLARGIGLLLSWIGREIPVGGTGARGRPALVTVCLAYVCYLLGGLTRLHFAISWAAAGGVVAGVIAVQTAALLAIHRWRLRQTGAMHRHSA